MCIVWCVTVLSAVEAEGQILIQLAENTEAQLPKAVVKSSCHLVHFSLIHHKPKADHHRIQTTIIHAIAISSVFSHLIDIRFFFMFAILAS